MSIGENIKIVIKKYFLAGLLVTVPLIVTYYVLKSLFGALDSMLNPLVHKLLGYNIPGLGAIVTILLVLLAGAIATNYLGARLIGAGDRLLRHTPLVRVIYFATKQLVQSVTTPRDAAFSEVVLVEYPRKGIYAIGFLAGRCQVDVGGETGGRKLVFIANSPTPFTGYVVLVRDEEVFPVDITLEAAIKLLVSGGIVTPDKLRMKNGMKPEEVGDAAGESPG
ncbi:MAG: DUF502 domain-containing protein [candidate division Zixibacteria bacterium]|nr:DUF502 domain-containing protein [candidate division Zixibacteria bacterium]